MYVLGINSYSHDSGACIIKDDGQKLEIVAIVESRLNRVKRSLDFPLHSIAYCLNHFGLKDLSEVHVICGVKYKTPYASTDEMLTNAQVERARKGDKRADADFYSNYVLNNAFFRKFSNVDWCHHLDAHAASAHFVSGFEDSVSLCLDAGGVGIYDCKGTHIEVIDRAGYSDHTIANKIPTAQVIPQEYLGTLFMHATAALGFSTEGTTMAMACFAKKGGIFENGGLKTPFWKKIFGQGELKLAAPDRPMDFCSLYKASIHRIHRYARRHAITLKKFRETKYAYNQEETPELLKPAVDIAYKTQCFLEEEMLRLAKLAKQKTGATKLTIAGGIGLSCVNNRLLHDADIFEDIFIQPAASDEGLAYGAALWAYYNVANGTKRHHMIRSYYGTEYSITDVEAAAARVSLAGGTKTPEAEVAKLIADGAIIGRFYGKSEFGPRALGNRSILADPRKPEISQKINKVIKKREWFRPFAPACTHETKDVYFDMPISGPFMIMAAPLRPEYYDKLAAIRHVDNSARPQTVTMEQNPSYYTLINEFGKLTGYSVLLNTSFNSKSEPIVETPYDAFLSAIEIGLDYLYIEGILYKLPQTTQTLQVSIDAWRVQQAEALKKRYEQLKHSLFAQDELTRYAP